MTKRLITSMPGCLGSRGLIKDCKWTKGNAEIATKEMRLALWLTRLDVFPRKSGEPSRTRTCDPLVKRAVRRVPSSHGSHDLLTFYTGCSRFGVHLVTAIRTCLPLFTSQICHNSRGELISECCSPFII